eukprot:TRINITY_DN15556_c0_g1_i2.p1 TRINITY_DN15556_c0_g1~~TRINITY_DN15556_c0_g1_i2.p1  ORF type:complete len:696 (-),score=174.82 TRINITY_DN15556_c0_g1_i2:207-2294(-)
MGNTAAHCGNGLEEVLQCDSSAQLIQCRRACRQCAASTDVIAPGHLQLCSWVEEEIHGPGHDPMVGIDYGLLGLGQIGPGIPSDTLPSSIRSAGFASSPTPSSPSTAAPIRRRTLYSPGGLIPIRGLHVSHHTSTPTSPAERKALAAAAKQKQKEKEAHPLQLPKELLEVYELDVQPLGRGSYGEVTSATHRRTKARRAIKSVGKTGLKKYVTDVSRFVRREVDILRRLDHPNIVRIYDACEDEDMLYLVLELCDGGDLLERVAVAKDRVPEKEAAGLLAQMFGAVQHLHLRGIVHRDLKPENFLFAKREAGREPLPPEVAPVKLIDFGLSRRLGFEAGMRITPKIGTSEYMAPEAFQGKIKGELADRTDLWSMGVILHVIFIGHFPSPRLAEQTPEEYLALPVWNRVSPSGRAMLASLLRQDPATRPTVTEALQHHWLTAALKWGGAEQVLHVPEALRTFAAMKDLQRLALVATAREVDECEMYPLRKLFQQLELECDGALTRTGLERASWLPGPLGTVAGEIAKHFDRIDMDGSKTVDWTELLAATIGAMADTPPSLAAATADGPAPLPQPKQTSEKETAAGAVLSGGPVSLASTSAGQVAGTRCLLSDDECWRAFELLSQGKGGVSGVSLMKLFDVNEGEEAGEAKTAEEGDGAADAKKQPKQELKDLDYMVREVTANGHLDQRSFYELMRS